MDGRPRCACRYRETNLRVEAHRSESAVMRHDMVVATRRMVTMININVRLPHRTAFVALAL